LQTGSSQAGGTVTAVTVGDGTTQRSNVTSVKITFNAAPTLTGTIAQEFTLVRTKKANGGGADTTTVTIANASVSGNVVTLSGFSGAAAVTGTGFTSLADGGYTLTVNAAFTGLSSNFTLADNGQSSASAGSFFRLAGDINGDRSVGGTDITPFVNGFGSVGPGLAGDINLDGHVGGTDITPFVNIFGNTV